MNMRHLDESVAPCTNPSEELNIAFEFPEMSRARSHATHEGVMVNLEVVKGQDSHSATDVNVPQISETPPAAV